eukprot:3463504-Rhodomonas_salina.1
MHVQQNRNNDHEKLQRKCRSHQRRRLQSRIAGSVDAVELQTKRDQTSEGLGKVVIVKRTGGTRGLGLFASVDIEAHRY